MNFQDSYFTELFRTTDSVSEYEINQTVLLKWIMQNENPLKLQLSQVSGFL